MPSPELLQEAQARMVEDANLAMTNAYKRLNRVHEVQVELEGHKVLRKILIREKKRIKREAHNSKEALGRAMEEARLISETNGWERTVLRRDTHGRPMIESIEGIDMQGGKVYLVRHRGGDVCWSLFLGESFRGHVGGIDVSQMGYEETQKYWGKRWEIIARREMTALMLATQELTQPLPRTS